jgi:hypothetical protein
VRFEPASDFDSRLSSSQLGDNIHDGSNSASANGSVAGSEESAHGEVRVDVIVDDQVEVLVTVTEFDFEVS